MTEGHPHIHIPGGQAKLCRLLSGIVALPSQALLRLAFLENEKRAHHRGRKEKGLSKSLGPTKGLPKAQDKTRKAHIQGGDPHTEVSDSLFVLAGLHYFFA